MENIVQNADAMRKNTSNSNGSTIRPKKVGKYLGHEFEMTEQRAKDVRRWRAEDHDTWRMIASRWAETFSENVEIAGNQLFGMDLCDAAASLLDENMYDEGTWN